MTPEDRIVCLCVRRRLNTDHLQQLAALCERYPIRWDAVYETARAQGVAPLVHLSLSRHLDLDRRIPPPVRDQFKKSYVHNVFVKRGTAAILEKILALCARKGIDVMLIKGAASNVAVHERPWYTVSGDVDLVVRPKREEIPAGDLQEIVAFLEDFNHLESVYREHLEYDFYQHHDMTMNGLLAVDPEQIWKEARKLQFRGHDVWVLSPEGMLLAAAINGCRKRFFRLKTLFEAMSIIERYPDLDWALLACQACTYRCTAMVYAALTVATMTLGFPLPEGALAGLKMNPARKLAIRRLAGLLWRAGSLASLSLPQTSTPAWRTFSWGLLLTYVTYTPAQIGAKLVQVTRAWSDPTSAAA